MTDKHGQFRLELLKMMHDRGFKGTTMRLLAERLDCDVANLYNYMESKQKMLDYFLFDISARFHQEIDLIRGSGFNAKDKLNHLVHMYVQMSHTKPYQMSLLVNEWRHLAEVRQKLFLRERKSFERKVRSIIEEGMAQGEFRILQPDIATHLVLSSTRWLFNYFTSPGGSINPHELERQISVFVETGILKS